MTLYRVNDAQVRDAVTGEIKTELVGEQVQIVVRDTLTPFPIQNSVGDPIADSSLTVTPVFTVPWFWIDVSSAADLYLDWYHAGSGARGPVNFDGVLRDEARAARESAEAAEAAAAAAQVAAEAALAAGGGGTGVGATWNTLPGRPDTFPAAPHTHLRSDLSDVSAIARQALGAADAQSFRQIIGAGTGNGTSNLTLGTTSTTAAPGNHTHPQYVDSSQAASIADARIAANGGGGGGGTTLDWEYRSGAYPALPATKPAGVLRVHAYGPVAPSSVPSWIGPAVDQARLSYDYDPTLS
jgi:hypothetical protein